MRAKTRVTPSIHRLLRKNAASAAVNTRRRQMRHVLFTINDACRSADTLH